MRWLIVLALLLGACVAPGTPTATPPPTPGFITPTPDIWTPTPPPPLEGQQLGNPELDGFDYATGDPRLNLQLTRELWYGGGTEKPPGQISGTGWSLVDFRGWDMQRASLIPRGPFDTTPPWDQLLVPDRYGDRNAQGLQCETSPCILYLQNSGPQVLGIPFQAGQSFGYGIEWNLVAINYQSLAQGFPTVYNWATVADDPIRVRIMGLHFNPALGLPPVFDSGWQDCETISDITDKPTCEPIDDNGNPILITLAGVFNADASHCPVGETCYLTFRVEFAVNSPAIATAELFVHSAWFNPQ